jgi:RsiW-degrading membrane proteinase PrsW (M82 family)
MSNGTVKAPGRTAVFWLEMFYLLGLGAIAWFYFTDRLKLPDAIGSVPTSGILWFGALGGVLLSLTGVFGHTDDWDPSFLQWHVARPFVGAAVGLVAVMVIQAGILTLGQNPTPNKDASRFVFYYVVAFLVGYREESFRELIRRLGDVILNPGSERDSEPRQ